MSFELPDFPAEDIGVPLIEGLPELPVEGLPELPAEELPEYDPDAPIPEDFVPFENICGRCGKSHPPEQECHVE